MTTLSVCLPIRNAEPTLERFLDSWRPHVDQISIVDTGSTDRTLEILADHARRPGAPIVVAHAKWEGDYALARNRAEVPAVSDYVMWADDDEILVGGENLRPLLAEVQPDVAVVRRVEVWCHDRCGAPFRARVYRRELSVRWRQAVHERLLFPDDVIVEPFSPGLVEVIHNPRRSTARHSHYENVQAEMAIRPTRHLRFYLARHIWFDDGDIERAAAEFEKVIDQSEPWASDDLDIIQGAFQCLAGVYKLLGRRRDMYAMYVEHERIVAEKRRRPLTQRCDALGAAFPIFDDHPAWAAADGGTYYEARWQIAVDDGSTDRKDTECLASL